MAETIKEQMTVKEFLDRASRHGGWEYSGELELVAKHAMGWETRWVEVTLYRNSRFTEAKPTGTKRLWRRRPGDTTWSLCPMLLGNEWDMVLRHLLEDDAVSADFAEALVNFAYDEADDIQDDLDPHSVAQVLRQLTPVKVAAAALLAVGYLKED